LKIPARRAESLFGKIQPHLCAEPKHTFVVTTVAFLGYNPTRSPVRRKSKAGGLPIGRSPSEKGEVPWVEPQRVTRHLAGGDFENAVSQTRTFLSPRPRLNWFADEYAIATV
jgi:hypothetical protein